MKNISVYLCQRVPMRENILFGTINYSNIRFGKYVGGSLKSINGFLVFEKEGFVERYDF